jgi:hypothetical protein
MLTVKIYLAAMSRADEPASRMAKLPRFYFYVDEFQSMMNQAFADILSESRKYKLALTLANQYIEQMDEEVRDAVFGNVGTLIVFRVGPFDAEVLETVFQPTFLPEDLVGLGIGQIYLTLMIDGVGSPPFSAETIPPIEAPAISYRNDVVMSSRALYSRDRVAVEAEINRRQTEFVAPPKEKKGGSGPLSSNGWNAAPQGGTTPRDKFAATPQEAARPKQTLSEKIREIQEHTPTPAPTPPVRAPGPRGHVNAVSVPRPQHQPPRPHDVSSKREAQEYEHRNALKDAIEKAKHDLQNEKAKQSVTPAKSPLELMREKNARKPQQPAHAAVPDVTIHEHTHHESHTHIHAHAAPKQDQKPQPQSHQDRIEETPQPKREQTHAKRTHERPREPEPQHQHHHGEVSHRELQRVLNGRDRDFDDL